jgi:hypothetical protein
MKKKILNGWCLYMKIVIDHKVRIQSYLESRLIILQEML